MDYKQFFFDLRGRLLYGQVSYDEAKKESEPVINEMNERGKAIAKKHGRRFVGFSFSSLVR